MKRSKTTIRIRYDEVDKMGYVYHGNYAKYFHISRTDFLRGIGICDKTLESQNIIMPITEMSIKYIEPIFYDDLIRITTTLNQVSGIKLKFEHLVYNDKNKIINKAHSTLVFVDSSTRKVMRIPENIFDKLEQNKFIRE